MEDNQHDLRPCKPQTHAHGSHRHNTPPITPRLPPRVIAQVDLCADPAARPAIPPRLPRPVPFPSLAVKTGPPRAAVRCWLAVMSTIVAQRAESHGRGRVM